MSCATLCQLEKMTTEKNAANIIHSRIDTIEEVILPGSMRGQLFKCVVDAPIRFSGVP